MTTLAIIGGGIAGRSLLYNLTALNISVDEVILFDSESFARPCSQNSIAVVALRGVTRGNSPLGDLIVDGHDCFRAHVGSDLPAGVYRAKHYIAGHEKLDQLKVRHPGGKLATSMGGIGLSRESYLAEEDGFIVDPPVYLDWLLNGARKKIKVTQVNDPVVDYLEGTSEVLVRTHSGKEFKVQHLVFATGAASRFWARKFPETLLTSSRPVQGAFLKFTELKWELPAFSLSFEGHNMVYRKANNELLMGATSAELSHELAPLKELRSIHYFFQSNLHLKLPDFEEGMVMVGVREKAKKRAPYLFTEGRVSFLGGLYKNGYILSLKMTRTLADQLRGRF